MSMYLIVLGFYLVMISEHLPNSARSKVLCSDNETLSEHVPDCTRVLSSMMRPLVNMCLIVLGVYLLITRALVNMYLTVLGFHLLMIVTNSYLGSIPVTNELHQVSKGSRSHLISGGNSSYSWVLVRALGPCGRRSCRL